MVEEDRAVGAQQDKFVAVRAGGSRRNATAPKKPGCCCQSCTTTASAGCPVDAPNWNNGVSSPATLTVSSWVSRSTTNGAWAQPAAGGVTGGATGGFSGGATTGGTVGGCCLAGAPPGSTWDPGPGQAHNTTSGMTTETTRI
ncbi:MAG: hypothetical protein IPI55_16825 [Flavobacteriales bacterium]|nr:hypothetical protein [Flavobacteriales bacterium]